MKFYDFHYSSNRTIKYLYLSEYFIVKKELQKAKLIRNFPEQKVLPKRVYHSTQMADKENIYKTHQR